MKTEEQKQVAPPNEFGQVLQATGRSLEKNAFAIVVVICAILVVAAGIVWWSRQASTATVEAWSLLQTAQSLDDFGTVADKYKSTPAGKWAKLRQSEMYLQNGMSTMFTERELALSDLKRAQEGFEQLASEKPSEPTIRERALWGLALTLETTSDGDTTKAIEAYQKLLNEIPDTIFKPLADNRVSELKTGGAKDFYAWFAKQNPKPVESRPKDGAMGTDDGGPLAPSEFRPNPPGTAVKAKTTEAPASEKPATDVTDKPEDGLPGTKTEDVKAEKATPPDSKPAEDGTAPNAKGSGTNN